MAKTLLSAREIQFASSTGRVLLHPTSVELHAGDRVALTGSSGGGKSLLLRCLVLLNAGQSGDLQFLGERVTANIPEFRARCLHVPQSPSLEGQETEPSSVLDLFCAPFQLQSHCEKSFDEQRICRWLRELNRDESFLKKPTTTLSGGEQQIVAILRALQLEPHVLLLDEPTSALDEETTLALEAIVKRWQSEAPNGSAPTSERALVWISHDSSQARRIGTRHWYMHDGRLEERSQLDEPEADA